MALKVDCCSYIPLHEIMLDKSFSISTVKFAVNGTFTVTVIPVVHMAL